MMCPAGCPPDGGITTTTNVVSGLAQDVIIYSIDHVQDLMVLRNTSAAVVDLSAGDLCRPFFYAPLSTHPASNQLPPLSDLTIHLTAAGVDTATDLYLNNPSFDLQASDEMVLYRDAAGHLPDGMEAYVRYGPAAPSGREAQAVMADLWTLGDRVEMCAGQEAFAASGDVTTELGFTSMDDHQACFP
jgi:hypothetical protein